MPTAYILSDLIIFIVYGVAWKWALMDMTSPLLKCVSSVSSTSSPNCSGIGWTWDLLQVWSLLSGNSHVCVALWKRHGCACSAWHCISCICSPQLGSAGFLGQDLTSSPVTATLWFKSKWCWDQNKTLFFQILFGVLPLRKKTQATFWNAVDLSSLWIYLLSLYVILKVFSNRNDSVI